MSPVLYSGKIYQYKSKNHWKESWMSLHKDGNLNWFKKDGYQLKSSIYLPDVLHHMKLEKMGEKHKDKSENQPFFMMIPIKKGQNKKIMVKRFAVMSGGDLLLWLDAFATVVDEWKIFMNVHDQQKLEISQSKEIGVDMVENSITYDEQFYYFKAIWDEYIQKHLQKKQIGGPRNGHSFSISETDHVTSSEDEASFMEVHYEH